MYSITTTPGFIIDSRPSGEAGKVLSIFTRELGLIWASAQGIRLEKSKLRYHALEYSFGVFSFVRGKEVWRLVSAQKDTLAFKLTGSSENHGIFLRDRQKLFARLALLLRRLLNGEDPHPELFDSIKGAISFLEIHDDLTVEEMKTFESLLVLRILHQLGYVGNVAELVGSLNASAITCELLNECVPVRTLMNQHINKALKESQL